MNGRSILSIVLRWTLVFAAVLAMILAWPDALLVLLTPLTGFLSNLTCPYLDSITLAIEAGVIHVRGAIHVGMVMADGSLLPVTPAQWQKDGQQTLNVLLVALPVWAMPPMPWRRRLLSLPLVLVGCLLVCGYDLSVQIQESALSMIGTQWLPGLPLAPTEGNVRIFAGLESWYESITWIKAFNDAGGRMILSVLAGLTGYMFVGFKGCKTPED